MSDYNLSDPQDTGRSILYNTLRTVGPMLETAYEAFPDLTTMDVADPAHTDKVEELTSLLLILCGEIARLHWLFSRCRPVADQPQTLTIDVISKGMDEAFDSEVISLLMRGIKIATAQEGQNELQS